MPYFATTYRYIDDSVEKRDEIRPSHRDFLGVLTEQGKLLLSGPFVGGEAGALLVFDTDTAEAALVLTNQDPFVTEGLVAEVSVREWQPVSGWLLPQT